LEQIQRRIEDVELHFGDHESFADDQFCLRILSVLSLLWGWYGIRDAPKIITGRFKEGIGRGNIRVGVCNV